MKNFNFFNPKWLAILITVCIGSLYLGGELKAQDIPQIGCACAEYVYLNEARNPGGKVHKYLVNADGTLVEINPGGPWYPNGTASEMSNPHGLGTDLNGFLYINETGNRNIRKLECDGTLLPTSEFSLPVQAENIISYGNFLASNRSFPNYYDLCDGSLAGTFCVDGEGASPNWGFLEGGDGNFTYGNGTDIYQFDYHSFTDGECVSQICNDVVFPPGFGNVGGFYGAPANSGIVTDANGFIHIVSMGFSRGDGLGSYVKIDPATCTIVASILESPDLPEPRGVVYSETCDCLYVSNEGDSVDCISVIDPNTGTYSFAAVGPTGDTATTTGDAGQPKAIAVNTECCPLFENFEDNYTFCLNEGENLFLIDFLPCEFICAGTWNVVSNNAGTYNSCNNSYTYEQAGTGCFNYSYTPTPGDANVLCQPFNIDICLFLSDSPASPNFVITDNVCDPFSVGSIDVVDFCVASTLEWSVDGGFSWSTSQPGYSATTPTAILARCNDTNRQQCYSTPAVGITNPDPNCPCTPIGSPVLGVSDNVCEDPSGSIDVITPCDAGSTIEYSLDGGSTWSTVSPVYDPINSLSVIARCSNNGEANCYSSESPAVVTAPGATPTAPVIGVSDNVCEPSSAGSFFDITPCQSGTVIEYSIDGGTTWSSTVPVYNPNATMDVVARCNNQTVAGCVSVESNSVSSSPVPCATDVSLVKSVDPVGPVNVGDAVTWTISVTNNGPSLAEGVSVSDALPACLTYVGNVPSLGSFDAASTTWTVGDLVVGQVETLEITTTVDAVGVCTNSAVVSMDTEDSDPTNNEDEAPIEAMLIDLELSKVANATVVNVGDQFDYTVEVCNQTDVAGGLIYDASGVEVFDQLPGNVSYITHVASQGTYSASTGSWIVGDMLNGSCEQLVITVLVDLPGTFDNTAQVSAADQPDIDSTPSNDDESEDDQETVPVTGEQIDLELDKAILGNVTEVNVGDQITYLVTLENKGPSVATGVSVTDNLPVQVSYVSDVPQQGSYDSASGEWTVGTVGIGQVLTLEITVTIDVESEAITNVAEVSAADQPDIDSEPDNDDGDQSEDEEDSVTIGGEAADLELDKDVSQNIVNVGDEIVFTLTLQNQGGSNAGMVEVTDELPACVEYVSYDGSDPSDVYNPFTGIWTVGDISVGESVTMDITVRVLTIGGCVNVAEVTNSDKPDLDSTPDNDEPDEDDQDEESIEGIEIDLELSKVANATVVNVGDQFDYTIEVCNINDAGAGLIYAASGVEVFDQLPGNVSYITHSASVGIYSASTGEWTIGNLGNGGCAQLVITVQADIAGDFDNVAQVSAADQPDIDSTPNNDDGDQSEDEEDIVPVTAEQIDLELDKGIVDDITAVRVGDQFTYILELTNLGPSAATGVSVLDNLPSEVGYISDVASQGSYSAATGEWLVGNVAVGAILTLEITVEVLEESDDIFNVAQVSAADQPDVDSEPGNDDGDQSEDEEDGVSVMGTASDLQLNKGVSQSIVNVGDQIVYTLTLENQGGTVANLVEVTDQLPACVDFVSYDGSDPSDSYNPVTGVWTVGTIVVGELVTMDLTVEVLVPGECLNVAEITNSDQPDLDSTPDNNDPDEDDQDEEPITGIQIDLELTKVGSVGPGDLVLVGDVIDYTIEVCNIMDAGIPLIYDATGVSVFDELPGSVQYLSNVASTGVYNPNTNEWGIGTILNGACEQLVITVEVISAGDILNVAQVSAHNEPDIDSEPNNDDGDQSEDEEDPHTFTATEQIDLELEKIKNVTGSVTLGQPVTFTINIINLGPSDATGVSVEDQLPGCLQYLSSSASLGSYSSGTGIWTIGSIPAGQSESLDITVVGTELGDCENVAQVASANEPDIDSNPNNDDGDQSEDEEDPEVVTFDDEQIDLELTKVVNTPTANVGDIVTFTISLTNVGPDDGTGIAVTDYLPSNMTLISAMPSQGSYNDFLNIWTVGSLDAGQTEVLTLEVRIDAAGYFDNVAEVTAQNEGDIDSNPGNDDGDQSEDDEDNAVVETPEILPIDLELVKNVVGPTEGYVLGDLVTFEIVLTNQGPGTATGVVVSDPPVIGLTYYSNSPSVGSYNVGTNEWVLAPGVSLLPGQSETLLLTYAVAAEGSLTNVAEVSAHNEDDIDSTPGNDDGDQSEDDEDPATITTDLDEVSDLELSKDINISSVEAGNTVIYTIILENKGPDGTTNVIVEDELPFGLIYINSSATQGTYSPGSNQWMVGSMLNGQVEALTITAQVDGNLPAGTVLINEAEVVNSDTPDIDSTPNNDDPNEDDQDDVPLTVIEDPTLVDIELEKTSAATVVETGDVFTYTILVENKGPATATNVSVTDQLPAGLTYQTNSASQGFYLSGTGEWTVGTLLAGQVETLDITVLVTTTATSGTIVNVAQVSGHDQTDIDSFPNNDDGDQSEDEEDNHPVTLGGGPGGDPVIDLELDKTVNTPTYAVGDAITYTITLENKGPDTGTGISVSDQLPAGLSYVSAFESQGSYSSSSGIWTVGTMLNGQVETLTITAVVIADLGVITNVAQVSAHNETDIDSAPNNDDGDQSEDDEAGVPIIPGDGLPIADLELTKNVNAGTVAVGDVVSYTIVLENKGPENTNGVTVGDQLPAGLTYINAVASQGFYDLATSTWTVGSMLNGQVETLTINATVNGSVTGPILNVAEVLTSSEPDIDSTPGNDDGDQSEDEEDNALITVIDEPVGQVDVSLDKSVPVSVVSPGELFTYTVVVANAGPDIATGVVVTDQLPAGLTYVSSTSSTIGVYNPISGDWSVGTLAVGGTASLSITVQVNANVADGATIVNVAEVTDHNEVDIDSSPDNDVLSEDDQDEVPVTVNIIDDTAIDLELEKTVDQSVVTAGSR